MCYISIYANAILSGEIKFLGESSMIFIIDIIVAWDAWQNSCSPSYLLYLIAKMSAYFNGLCCVTLSDLRPLLSHECSWPYSDGRYFVYLHTFMAYSVCGKCVDEHFDLVGSPIVSIVFLILSFIFSLHIHNRYCKPIQDKHEWFWRPTN